MTEERPFWGLLLGDLALIHDGSGKLIECKPKGEMKRLFGWFETEGDCQGMAEDALGEAGARPNWVLNTEPIVPCGKCNQSFAVSNPHTALMIFEETREVTPQLIREVKAVRFCPSCHSGGIVGRMDAIAQFLTQGAQRIEATDTTKH